MSKLNIEILTPFGVYLEQENIDILNVPTSESVLGILPNHAPLIAEIMLGEINMVIDGKREYFATTGGLLYVKKEKTILLLDTIEKGDEIDLARAIAAKERAENKLKNKTPDSDENLIKASLSRALNRIKVANKYN